MRLPSTNRLSTLLCGLALACAPAPRSVAAAVVVLPAVADNTLYEDGGDSLSNGAGPTMFVGRTAQGADSRRRALVRFSPSDSLPAGAVIESVSVRLTMSRTRAGATTVSLHRVLEAWGEGGSNAGSAGGDGATATPGDATWFTRVVPDLTWSSPGGAFAATASASLIVDPDDTYVWGSTPLLVADVQSWLDDPSVNFGWLLRGDEATTRTAKRFDTREAFDPATRPALIITYRESVVGVDPLPQALRHSWGAVKTMYRGRPVPR